MQLTELKEWYNRYQDFWPEWKKHHLNGLSAKDISAIETWRKNKFILGPSHEILERLVTSSAKKLKNTYSHYQEWVVIRFQFFLMNKARQLGWDYFYETPIGALKVNKELIEKLLLFKCRAVKDIVNTYGESSFNTESAFSELRAFYLQQDPDQDGWDYFYDLPIETLPVSTKAIDQLKSKGCQTFAQVMDQYGKSRLLEPDLFAHVLKFKRLMASESGIARGGNNYYRNNPLQMFSMNSSNINVRPAI